MSIKLNTVSTKKKFKEASYLSMNMAVYKSNGKDVKEKDLNDFLDDFIKLVESKKMCCGGGMTLRDGEIREC